MSFANWLRLLKESCRPLRRRRQRASKTSVGPSHTKLNMELLEDRTLLTTITVVNTLDSGIGSLRQAIDEANTTPDMDLIDFNIAATDPRHFYYQDDGVADKVDLTKVMITTAADDSLIADIDPDWAHSWYSIQPTSALPAIIAPVTIDGYTQDGASANTLANGIDAVLRIELDGSTIERFPNGHVASGLAFAGNGSTVRGMVINRFLGNGIALGDGVTEYRNNRFEGNFIGTDASGTLDRGNGQSGVSVGASSANTVGGIVPAARNLISANREGVSISSGYVKAQLNLIAGNFIGTDASGLVGLGNHSSGIFFNLNTDTAGTGSNIIGGTTAGARNVISANGVNTDGHGITGNGVASLIQGNYIGIAADGSSPLGNFGHGIAWNTNSSTIGGTAPGAGNIIAFNRFDGISIPNFGNTSGNAILGNSIYGNAGSVNPNTSQNLGIDLGGGGPTPNDAGDADAGANNLQNFPVLTAASLSNIGTTIDGTLNSTANSTFRIEFFANTAADPSGFGEGQTYLGFANVSTDANGDTGFSASFAAGVPGGQFITATATDAGNNTSEFSRSVQVVTAPISADLSITLGDAPDPISPGDNISYAILVTNNDSAAASGFTLATDMPEHTTFVSFTVFAGGSTTTPAAGGTGTITFHTSSLAPGASARFTLVVRVDADTAAGTVISSTASVSGSNNDPDLDNNSATTTTTTNQAPFFTSDPGTEGLETLAYVYAIMTDDPDGDTRSIVATLLPGWLTLTDHADGAATLSGTPGTADVGIHDVTLQVTDTANNVTRQSFRITVGPATQKIAFSLADYSVREADGTATITVLRTGSTRGVATVHYSLMAGTAESDDYTDVSGTLTFGDGVASRTFQIAIAYDITDEFDDTILLTLDAPNEAALGTLAAATLTVVDETAMLSLDESLTVLEGDTGFTDAVFVIMLTPSERQVSVEYRTTTNGTARANDDFVPQMGTLIFAPGVVEQTVVVQVIGDALNEDDVEKFALFLDRPVNATLAARFSYNSCEILDNDPLPIISISDVSVMEGNTGETEAVFIISLSAPSGRIIRGVPHTLDVTATLINGDFGDFRRGQEEFFIAPGETSTTFSMRIKGDVEAEHDETFLVQLDSLATATVGDGEGVGTILNDEYGFFINDVEVVEGNSGTTNAVFTVTLYRLTRSASPITVDYKTADDPHHAGEDYKARSGRLTFTQFQSTAQIVVPIIGDTIYERSHAFFVHLTGSNGASILDGIGTCIIVNDDAPPVMRIRDVTVTEGNTARFKVTIEGRTEALAHVMFTQQDQSAVLGIDYLPPEGNDEVFRGLFVLPGSAGYITVFIRPDQIYEPNKTFLIKLFDASHATILDDTAVGTIVDDDFPPTLLAEDVTVVEGNTGSIFAAVNVRLFGLTEKVVTVNYETRAGTAAVVADYAYLSGALTFQPGETLKTVYVPIFGDQSNEPEERLSVYLFGVHNAGFTDRAGNIRIIDNDAPPSLSINNVTVLEGNSGTTNARFTVTLSHASGYRVEVGYATASNTALRSIDFFFLSGVLIFEPGQTTKTFQVQVRGDTAAENDESFVVNLSNPSNATLSRAQGLGFILNDDRGPVSAFSALSAEGQAMGPTLDDVLAQVAKKKFARNTRRT